MAWNIPKQVAQLLVGDEATARAFGNVTRALQPVLDFCNSTFSLAQNGSLQLARNIILQALTVNGQVTVNGAQVVYGAKGVNNTLVVVPGGSGAAFYVTNPANSQANFLVNSDGTVYGLSAWNTSSSMTAGSFVSPTGFKQTIFMGVYWNTNTTTGDSFYTYCPIYNTRNAGFDRITRTWRANRSGSLVGTTVSMNNSIAISSGWTILKNGATIAVNTVPANAMGNTASYPKNTSGATFVAGDIFTCIINVAAGYNFAGQIDMDIEVGA